MSCSPLDSPALHSLPHHLTAGMVGMGMIFDDTYAPFFSSAERGLFDPATGPFSVSLTGAATRTGRRAESYQSRNGLSPERFASFTGPNAVRDLLGTGVDFVCVATPDNRHFEPAKAALSAGKHVLIEKPSVLSLQELDELLALAQQNGVLAKVVYHKLLDPDHKRLRTFVHDGVLRHVNHGYCSLLEPKSISGGQFAEWIAGRNPGTYVAVHYIKLIDFTFGGRLKSVVCTGQRGLVGPVGGDTWDSTQLRLGYEFPDGREAAFDIHTSWVTPDNFPGSVEQEVQFRFDNGVWNGHSRRRGVECTVEGKTPHELKSTLNNHYSASFLEPWGDRSCRGYGVEVIERFAREVAFVEFGGSPTDRGARLEAMKKLAYNDLSAERQVVAAVEGMEAILNRHAAGFPNAVVEVDTKAGGLVLLTPGRSASQVLYSGPISLA